MSSRISPLVVDGDEFGPGTDLVVSLVAVLLIILVAGVTLYTQVEKDLKDARAAISARDADIDNYKGNMALLELKLAQLKSEMDDLMAKTESGGNFRMASERFTAGYFKTYPVGELVNPREAARHIDVILQEYRLWQDDFPFLFVIGHANEIDVRNPADPSISGRRQRNWYFAGKRAAVIARMLEERIGEAEKDRIVVASTGEFDMKTPLRPSSSENAFVEVVFARDWKLPALLMERDFESR